MANVTVNFAIVRGTASLSAGSATTNNSGFATITANLTNLSANVQVSACVAPNNAPCQTFTLFAWPPSLWTLETVSGSSQVLLTGQAFQPLVMRVTDGSAAANPVMGVNVSFATTLARVSENGMPVLLGSSQVPVATDQNGLASIVPSAGNVGPCDVFITVSAGQSTAQLQMESLAAIVTGSTNGPAKAPSARPAPNFASNFGSNFGSNSGSQTPAPQGALEVSFAVPEVAPLDEPVASAGRCSSARQDTASSTDASSGATGNFGNGNAVSCEATPELPKVEAPRLPVKPSTEPPAKPPADSTQRDNGGGAAGQPAEAPAAEVPSSGNSSANPPSANDPASDNPAASRLLEDRRSCRFAQSEDGIFFGTTLGSPP